MVRGVELARQLGFDRFIVVNSARYNDDDGFTPSKGMSDVIREVVDATGYTKM